MNGHTDRGGEADDGVFWELGGGGLQQRAGIGGREQDSDSAVGGGREGRKEKERVRSRKRSVLSTSRRVEDEGRTNEGYS